MIKALNFIALSVIATSLWAAAPIPDSIQKYAKERGWTDIEIKKDLAVKNVIPIYYFAKDTSYPSCALLQQRANSIEYVEVLVIEGQENYPHCLDFDSITNFRMAGTEYFMYVYSNRALRDIVYENFFFAHLDSSQKLVADDKLNELDNPENRPNALIKKTPPHHMWYHARIADGIALAKTALIKSHLSPQTAGYQFSSRDFISAAPHSFSIFLNPKTTTCLYVTESAGQLTQKESKNCSTFLASGKLEQPEKTYFLGIYKTPENTQKIEVFSIDKTTNAVKDETRLADAIIQAGKQTDIKSAKKFLSDIKTKP